MFEICIPEQGLTLLTIRKGVFGGGAGRETLEESAYLLADVTPAIVVLDPIRRVNRT